MIFNSIVCVDKNYGIGKNNNIPWKYKLDLEHFKRLTTENNNDNTINIVLMGNNTYKSIPFKFRPLSNRLNIILSRTHNITTKLPNLKDIFNNSLLSRCGMNIKLLETLNKELYFNDISKLLIYLNEYKKYINIVWVIGGKDIYDLFLNLQIISTLYLTYIENQSYECDKYFSKKKLNKFKLKESKVFYDINILDTDKMYRIQSLPGFNSLLYYNKKDKLVLNKYEYYNKDENNYLNIIRKILKKGTKKIDRTKVGTIGIFGVTLKYDIRNYRLPLFTHRKMFLRGIIEELLFFISGKTDTKILEEKGVNIWKGNTSREFLDKQGLNHLKEGDMGASYPFQLKYFNAEYINCDTDYTGKGFDQLNYVIDLLKNDPTSRRIVINYWNPTALNKTCLPACHIIYIFNVDIEKNELNCSFTMRGNDFCLAHCFNICHCSILIFMLCYLTNLNPGKIICHIGDCHIYNTHIEETKKFIKNKPMNFPLLYINDFGKKIEKIEDFKYENFKLLFYNSYGTYKMQMAT